MLTNRRRVRENARQTYRAFRDQTLRRQRPFRKWVLTGLSYPLIFIKSIIILLISRDFQALRKYIRREIRSFHRMFLRYRKRVRNYGREVIFRGRFKVRPLKSSELWRFEARKPISRPPGSVFELGREPLILRRLPLEVRKLIWRAAIGDRIIYLSLWSDFDGKRRKCRRSDRAFLSESLKERREPGSWLKGRPRVTRDFFSTKENLLALPLACKQIYLESIPVLYSANTFNFSDQPWLLVNLQKLMLPSRIDSLTSLTFAWTSLPAPDSLDRFERQFVCSSTRPWYLGYSKIMDSAFFEPVWDNVWAKLASMKGLRKLRVELEVYVDNYPVSDDLALPQEVYYERKALAAARQVITPQIFELVFEWPRRTFAPLDLPPNCQIYWDTGIGEPDALVAGEEELDPMYPRGARPRQRSRVHP